MLYNSIFFGMVVLLGYAHDLIDSDVSYYIHTTTDPVNFDPVDPVAFAQSEM